MAACARDRTCSSSTRCSGYNSGLRSDSLRPLNNSGMFAHSHFMFSIRRASVSAGPSYSPDSDSELFSMLEKQHRHHATSPTQSLSTLERDRSCGTHASLVTRSHMEEDSMSRRKATGNVRKQKKDIEPTPLISVPVFSWFVLVACMIAFVLWIGAEAFNIIVGLSNILSAVLAFSQRSKTVCLVAAIFLAAVASPGYARPPEVPPFPARAANAHAQSSEVFSPAMQKGLADSVRPNHPCSQTAGQHPRRPPWSCVIAGRKVTRYSAPCHWSTERPNTRLWRSHVF